MEKPFAKREAFGTCLANGGTGSGWSPRGGGGSGAHSGGRGPACYAISQPHPEEDSSDPLPG